MFFPLTAQPPPGVHPKEEVQIAWLPDQSEPKNAFGGDVAVVTVSALKKHGFIMKHLAKRPLVFIYDKGLETVRTFWVDEPVMSMEGSHLTLKSGKRVSFDSLKEVSSTRAFSFVSTAMFPEKAPK